MAARATGTFEVKMNPAEGDPVTDPRLGRMLLDKAYHGDLEAVGVGQMLAARTDVEGSAGYVAIEKVSGTLDGRRGSFVLLHRGVMTRGEPELEIRVVPDSGTEELAGLAGRMSIEIADGVHSYELEYTHVGTP